MKEDERKMFKDMVALNMGTQYGMHCGLDALQIQELTTPNVNMGMGKPKGDNNRKPGSMRQGSEGYFTVGSKY